MKVFHGITNTAGVPYKRKLSLLENGIDATNVSFNDILDYPADLKFDNPYKLLKYFFTHLTEFDIYHFYTAKSFDLSGQFIDLEILKSYNKKVIMEFTGSDIRCYENMEKEVQSGFRKYSFCPDDHIGIKDYEPKKKLIENLIKYCDGFIAYPCAAGLLGNDYTEINIPTNFENIQLYNNNEYKKNNNILKVLHIATSPSVKGTKFIKEIEKRIVKKYDFVKFEYILGHNYTNEEVLKKMYESDIVIDGLIHGVPGQVTMEAFALGKCVIAHYNKNLITYKDIPVIETTPETLYENLCYIIDNSEKRREISSLGIEFLKKNLSLEKTGKDLIDFYNKQGSLKLNTSFLSRLKLFFSLVNNNVFTIRNYYSKKSGVLFKNTINTLILKKKLESKKILIIACARFNNIDDIVKYFIKNNEISILATKNNYEQYKENYKVYVLNSKKFEAKKTDIFPAIDYKYYDYVIVPIVNDNIDYYNNVFLYLLNIKKIQIIIIYNKKFYRVNKSILLYMYININLYVKLNTFLKIIKMYIFSILFFIKAELKNLRI